MNWKDQFKQSASDKHNEIDLERVDYLYSDIFEIKLGTNNERPVLKIQKQDLERLAEAEKKS